MPTPQRISLIEAYNNRDVIAWLVRHTKEIKDLQDLVDALPASDKFVLTIGDQTINGTKSFVQKIVAAGGIEADTLVKINADLQVYGDIYQNGAAYDTHAEQLYSTKDYILMREGAVTALSPGTMSGFEIIKYDGANNLRLGVDSSGTARVGDVGDEQPLLTRDEAADLTDGAPLIWDAANNKAISGGGFSRVIKNSGSLQVGPTGWNASGTFADYPYELAIQIPGVTLNDFPIVSFMPVTPELDLLAPVAATFTNNLVIYAKSLPTQGVQLNYLIIQED